MIADRYALQQSWWILSELARRHPRMWLDHTMDAAAGSALIAQHPDRAVAVIATLHSGIQVHGAAEPLSIDWPRVFAGTHPHQVIKLIERRTPLGVPRDTPSTTEASLIYRLAARFLALRLDDRHDWSLVPLHIGHAIVQLSRHGEHPLVTGFPTVRATLIDILSEVQRQFGDVELGLIDSIDPPAALCCATRLRSPCWKPTATCTGAGASSTACGSTATTSATWTCRSTRCAGSPAAERLARRSDPGEATQQKRTQQKRTRQKRTQ